MTTSPQTDNPGSRNGILEKQSPASIIDFILARFHRPLRHGLPILFEQARQIELSAEQHPSCPWGLSDHLALIRWSVESHLDKEEKILFPLLRAGRGATAFMPIKVMMAEHDDHLANLRRLRELTSDFTPPADADGTWTSLYHDLAKLEAELCEHIRMENDILFTRAADDESTTL
jgi:regulator of cell morphogenesis and NO signaling